MNPSSFSRVLIANRGEIALRIKRAAEKLGIASVMLCSESDRGALHARGEVLILEGNAASETYLDGEKIVALAKRANCDAVHPGYGFLSENAEFARAVSAAGMKFIGPSAEVIDLMGDKIAAKALAEKALVPLAPSLEIESPEKALLEVEQKVGFPLILKARAGGGGRGMRLVENASSFLEECKRAQAEAEKFFGNGAIFAESYISMPRHVEVQVFGDGKGTVFHLGTRDCSTQRRHQKLVEEAPAPFLSDEVRTQLHESAVSLARAVNYEGAGTVEYLVKEDSDGKTSVFFLEMNTRIQVEHPVTECIYGIDLVEWQFRVAMGEELPEDIFTRSPEGHAIEFRIYAEKSANNFAPAIGNISSFVVPADPFLREDGGVATGSRISPYFDALLTKFIVRGETRSEALQHARRILKRSEIEGIETTRPFHLWLTHESPFSEGPVDIGFVGTHFSAKSLQNVPLYEKIDESHKTSPLFASVEQVSIVDTMGESQEITITHRKDGLFEGQRGVASQKEGASISQTKRGVLDAFR